MEPKDPDQLGAERLPVGSSFFLNEDLTISSGLLGVGTPSIQIQNGRIVRRFSVQQFEPYCEFILNTSARGDTFIGADNFIVESVFSSLNFMRRDSESELYGAGPGFRLARSDSGDSGSEGFFIMLVEYSLSSDYQGSDFRMRCRSVVAAGTPRTFTVGELRAILGDLFSIQVAANRELEIQ